MYLGSHPEKAHNYIVKMLGGSEIFASERSFFSTNISYEQKTGSLEQINEVF